MNNILERISKYELKKQKKLKKYAIVTEDGKIIEKYMWRQTAMSELPRLEKIYLQKLKVIKLY